MLTCIAGSKQSSDDSVNQSHNFSPNDNQANKQAIKSLSSQIKDMALKASGAYRHCNSCTSQPTQQRNGNSGESESVLSASSERFRWSYRRTGSSNSSSTAGRKELEARLKGISSGEGTPVSASGRRVDPIVFVEENEPQEWVAQVEPGVLITFVSLPRGGNDLKRLRFSREMFNKWQAQRWWTDNYEKIMELYNVQRPNRQGFPLSTPPRSEDEGSKIESLEDSPVTPPLSRERLPRTLYRPTGMGYSSSDSLEQQKQKQSTNNNSDSTINGSAAAAAPSTPKLSNLSVAKTDTSSSSVDHASSSMRTSSSRDADRSGDISISNASDLETEWVEQDEPGVYISIRALADGRRELRRVRFSREKFGEMHARIWWEANRARVHKQYL